MGGDTLCPSGVYRRGIVSPEDMAVLSTRNLVDARLTRGGRGEQTGGEGETGGRKRAACSHGRVLYPRTGFS